MNLRISVAALFVTISMGAGASQPEARDLIDLGGHVFSDNCQKCHQIDGYGEEELYPSLHDPKLLANKPLLIRTILHGRTGQQGDGTVAPLMPSLDFLTNREISAIIAFISNNWGEDTLLVTDEDINEAR